jgi:hypothetical protein
VYQWSAGQRAPLRQIPVARRAAGLFPRQAPLPPEPPGPAARQPEGMSAAALFSQLFPSGLQMTSELLADLELWAPPEPQAHRQGQRYGPLEPEPVTRRGHAVRGASRGTCRSRQHRSACTHRQALRAARTT